MAGQTIYSCQICREHKERGGIRSADSVREPVVEVIRKEYSGWSEKGYICTADLNRFRARYVRKILEKEREYYTKFAQALPKDTVILTAGCAKYRYNSLNLGTIGGIPRVLDAGQCNDCYSLVVIAQELAKAFGVGIK